MNLRIVRATASRILHQLRRDPRTLALLMLAPILLITLLKYVFDKQPMIFDQVGLPLVGIFPLMSMFLVTSIAMLRERTSGTLERLMTLPLRRADILFGYGLAFAVVATVQATLVSLVAVGLLGLDVAAPLWCVIVLAVINATLGMALGLFLSAFAATEFQAVQFLPAFLLPQLLLCGIFAPRSNMVMLLRWISDVAPMTYAYDALHRAGIESTLGSQAWTDAAITACIAVGALVLGSATLRRRTL